LKEQYDIPVYFLLAQLANCQVSS